MNYHRAIIAIGLTTHLQASEITWDVTASGGFESSGGPYSMTATIGEPLAGSAALNSAAYGFWSLLPSVPREPQILIRPLARGQIEVSWSPANAGWILLWSPDLKEWKKLGATNPWTGPQRSRDFFRLQLPKSN